MSIGRLGITITVWDDRDNEVASQGAWVAPSDNPSDYRAMYDDLCAVAWPMLIAAIEAARDNHANVGYIGAAGGDLS